MPLDDPAANFRVMFFCGGLRKFAPPSLAPAWRLNAALAA